MENSALISHILISSRQEPRPRCQVFNPSCTPFKAAAGTFFQCVGNHLVESPDTALCGCGQQGVSFGHRYPICHLIDQPEETNDDHTKKSSSQLHRGLVRFGGLNNFTCWYTAKSEQK